MSLMAFRRKNLWEYEFEVDGDLLSIKIRNFGFHQMGFELVRETNNKLNINLIKVIITIKDIILSHLEENKKICFMNIMFLDSDKFDKNKWMMICDNYIRKYLGVGWYVNKDRFIINCSKI